MDIKVKPIIEVRKEKEELTKGKAPEEIEVRDKTAVIICHGMGQQVKFETLSLVSDIILKKEKEALKENNSQKVFVRLINYNDTKIPRTELKIKNENDELQEIHLYEVYWAPLTEGRINAGQTLRFLLSSAKEGFIFSLKGYFKRWVFGSEKPMAVKYYTGIFIFLVFILLLTLTLLFFLSSYISFISILSWIYDIDSYNIIIPITKIYPLCLFENLITSNYKIFLFISLIISILLFKGKSILKQYVGDIAAYISPFKVSKFAQIRNEIHKQGMEIAKFVYGLKDDRDEKNFEYKNIIFIGHSLGSVIAYDTLNAIINEYMDANGYSSAPERTKLLLTFGSPLDKTAFIFRTQKDNLPVREALSEAIQPLIKDYRYRPDSWINIYSYMDIISGKLDYYDDPLMNKNDSYGRKFWSKRINNLIDKQCWVPLVAHVQYWKSDLLAKELYKALIKDWGKNN